MSPDKPTTLKKLRPRRERSPLVTDLGVYGSEFARLARYARAWRWAQLELFAGTRTGKGEK